MEPALSQIFLEHLPGDELRGPWAALPGLESALRSAWERARAARPGIDLAAEDFVAHVGARWPAARAPDEQLGALNLPDLYLACACMKLRPGAAEVLEREYLAHVPNMLATLGLTGAQVEQAVDQVRDRLLGRARDEEEGAADPRPWPGLAGYGGSGALLRWLDVTAKRVGLNVADLLAEKARSSDDEQALRRLGESPELAQLKGLDLPAFAPAYRAAIQEAFAALSPEERAVLKLHHLDGLTLREICKIYGGSEATISRRLKALRERLADEIRQRLRQRLGLDAAQAESLRGFLQSQLDLSLGTLLR